MIQIDMPTPKSCADCCFATADLINGIITLFCMTPAGRKMYAPDLISRKDRPEWCPITEQQNVVRCKDCKYAHKTYDGDCKYCDMFTDDDGNPIEHYRSGDWFCADGKRMEDR